MALFFPAAVAWKCVDASDWPSYVHCWFATNCVFNCPPAAQKKDKHAVRLDAHGCGDRAQRLGMKDLMIADAELLLAAMGSGQQQQPREVVVRGMDCYIQTILVSVRTSQYYNSDKRREDIKILGALSQTAKWIRKQVTPNNKRKFGYNLACASMYDVIKKHISILKVKHNRRLVFKFASDVFDRSIVYMKQNDQVPHSVISTSARLLHDMFTVTRTIRSGSGDVCFYFSGSWPRWSNSFKVAAAVRQLMVVCRSRYARMAIGFARSPYIDLQQTESFSGGEPEGLQAILTKVFKWGPPIVKEEQTGQYFIPINAIDRFMTRPPTASTNGNLIEWEQTIAGMIHTAVRHESVRHEFGASDNYCLYVKRVPDAVNQPEGGYIRYRSDGDYIVRIMSPTHRTRYRIANGPAPPEQLVWEFHRDGLQAPESIPFYDFRVQASVNEVKQFGRVQRILWRKKL